MLFRIKMLTLYVILGLAIMAGLIMISLITRNEIIQMEKKECQIGAERVKKFFQSQLIAATNNAVSVTLWDDYYHAIQTKDQEWIQKNVLSMVKPETQMEFIVTFDPSGKAITALNAPEEFQDLTSKTLATYRNLSRELHAVSDFVKTNEAFYMITLVEIVKTEDKEYNHPSGYTLYGRRINPALLDQAANFIGFHIRLADQNGHFLMTKDFQPVHTSRNGTHPSNIIRGKAGMIITYFDQLNNNAGQRISYLDVQMSSNKGTAALDSFFKGFWYVGIFLMVSFILCFIAIHRVGKLERQVAVKDAQEKQMQIYQEVLEHKITERTANLQQANLELEQKNRELVDLQTQIIQQEKLASIGLLAAGVAHEINNPIGFISGNFNALKKYSNTLIGYFALLKQDHPNHQTALQSYWEEHKLDFILDDIPGLLSESEDGIERVIHIVKSLKDFSRIDHHEKTDYDLNQGIESTLVIAKNTYKYVAEVKKDLQPIPFIKANGGEINEVILNIIVNAAQAIEEMKAPEKKRIAIKTYHTDTHVYCEIEDNGPGIPETIRDHIFDPFFTTKEPGKGTGLGLSISYNIITQKHHGSIKVTSELGKGTKFTIQLPLEAKC